MLSSLKFVDKIFVQNSFEQKADDIKKYNVDILVSSDDWLGKYDYLKNLCEVIYLQRTPRNIFITIKIIIYAIRKVA